MKCKPYSEIRVEIGTQLKTVKITLNISAVHVWQSPYFEHKKMGKTKTLKSSWLQAKTFLNSFLCFKVYFISFFCPLSTLFLLSFPGWYDCIHSCESWIDFIWWLTIVSMYFYQISLDLSFVGHDLNWGHMPLGMQYTKKVGRHTSFECNL